MRLGNWLLTVLFFSSFQKITGIYNFHKQPVSHTFNRKKNWRVLIDGVLLGDDTGTQYIPGMDGNSKKWTDSPKEIWNKFYIKTFYIS